MKATDQRGAVAWLGSGISYREDLRDQILASSEEIDVLEFVVDHFIDDLDRLRELRERFTLVPHGLQLSIASPALDRDYLRAIKRVSDASSSPYYGDHLAMTRAPGVDIGHLSPVWFTEETLELVSRNVAMTQDYLEKQLILENISYAFEIPDASMSEPEFLMRLTEQTGCGLLLDLTNLNTNATNHAFDPIDRLDELPRAAVVQLHIAGGYWHDGVLIDGHCAPVDEGTWELLGALADRAQAKVCILEHDDRFPDDFSVLLEQVQRARQVLLDGRPPEVDQRQL